MSAACACSWALAGHQLLRTRQRQHAKGALVDAAQRLVAHAALAALDAERELAQGQRALGREAAPAQARQRTWRAVLGAVDDAQVLRPTALDRRLHESAPPVGDKLQWLNDHALAALAGQLLPPCRRRHAGRIIEVDDLACGWLKQRGGIASAELIEQLQVPCLARIGWGTCVLKG